MMEEGRRLMEDGRRFLRPDGSKILRPSGWLRAEDIVSRRKKTRFASQRTLSANKLINYKP